MKGNAMPTTAHTIVVPAACNVLSSIVTESVDRDIRAILGPNYDHRMLLLLEPTYGEPMFPDLYEHVTGKPAYPIFVPDGTDCPLDTLTVLPRPEREYFFYTMTNCTLPALGGMESVCFNACNFKNCILILDGAYSAYPIFLDCTFENCTIIRMQYTNAAGVVHRGLSSFGNCTFDAPDIPQELGAHDYYDPAILPREGAFTMWKKLYSEHPYQHPIICQLIVPAHAKRTRGAGDGDGFNSTKIRVSEAMVAGIKRYTMGKNREVLGAESLEYGYSIRTIGGDSAERVNLLYEVGKPVTPDSFDASNIRTCTHGIHGFMEWEKARDY